MQALDRNRKREYCEILGVPFDANEKVVKKAYHKLALELHPDRPQNRGKEGVDMQFKKVAEAYEHLTNGNQTLNSLKNSLKTEEMHASLEHFFFTTKSHSNSLNNLKFSSISATEYTNSGSGSGHFSSRGLGNLSNLGEVKLPSFNNQGGGLNTNSGSVSNRTTTTTTTTVEKMPRRGQSLKTTLRVSFDEGVNGCTKILEFSRSMACKNCEGLGAFASFSKLNCRDCGGTGSLSAVIGGMPPVQTPCPTCSSVDTKEKCAACNGTGKVNVRKTCTVDVPAGVVSGSTKVFHGQGDEGFNGGEPGDFIVCFEVEEHPHFRREGDHAYGAIEISFPHAVLGTTVEINTIYSKPITISIEPGIQHGQFIRVNGQGFQNESNTKGDFFIQVNIHVPQMQLQKEERELLQQLANLPSFQFKSIQK